MSQKSSAPTAKAPAERVVRDIRRATRNRAPIEDVRACDPAAQRAEVRYYRRDHEDEAARLVALIQRVACLEGEGERMRDLRAVFIGNRFQNLPDGCIELWFPQLAPRPG